MVGVFLQASSVAKEKIMREELLAYGGIISYMARSNAEKKSVGDPSSLMLAPIELARVS